MFWLSQAERSLATISSGSPSNNVTCYSVSARLSRLCTVSTVSISLIAFQWRLLRFHPYSLSILKSRINAFRFSYFVNAPFVWNQLPLPILESLSLSTFTFSLSKMLLNVSYVVRHQLIFLPLPLNQLTPWFSYECVCCNCMLRRTQPWGLPLVQLFPNGDKIQFKSIQNFHLLHTHGMQGSIYILGVGGGVGGELLPQTLKLRPPKYFSIAIQNNGIE